MLAFWCLTSSCLQSIRNSVIHQCIYRSNVQLPHIAVEWVQKSLIVPEQKWGPQMGSWLRIKKQKSIGFVLTVFIPQGTTCKTLLESLHQASFWGERWKPATRNHCYKKWFNWHGRRGVPYTNEWWLCWVETFVCTNPMLTHKNKQNKTVIRSESV